MKARLEQTLLALLRKVLVFLFCARNTSASPRGFASFDTISCCYVFKWVVLSFYLVRFGSLSSCYVKICRRPVKFFFMPRVVGIPDVELNRDIPSRLWTANYFLLFNGVLSCTMANARRCTVFALKEIDSI